MTDMILRWLALVVIIVDSPVFVSSFLPYRSSSHRKSRRFGLSEWRILQKDTELPLLLLPFAANRALLPGQSTEIVLKDGRFFDLFQDAIDLHESVLGMALVGEDGFLDNAVLCEIRDFHVKSGFRGRISIQVVLQGVGRCHVKEFTQMKPVLMAHCVDFYDRCETDGEAFVKGDNENVDAVSSTVADIESIVANLGREHDYQLAYENAFQQLQLLDDDLKSTSRRELAAKSWAVFTIATTKNSVYEAISCRNVIKRLQLGLKTLLDEQYQQSSNVSSSLLDGGTEGFE